MIHLLRQIIVLSVTCQQDLVVIWDSQCRIIGHLANFMNYPLVQEMVQLESIKTIYPVLIQGLWTFNHKIPRIHLKRIRFCLKNGKMGPLFPILNMKPELFTTNISFDYTYEVYKSSLIDVDLIALTDFTIPGEDADTIVVEVKNGDLGVTLKQLLGDSYFKLSKSQVKSYKELTEDMAASIDTGWLSLSTEFSTDNVVVSATAYKEEIPVGDNIVNLAITINFTLKFNPFSEEYEVILEIALAAIVIGVIAIMTP